MPERDESVATVTAPTRSREDDLRDRFEREAGTHRMTVLHDEGVYRHLRFRRPGTWSYGYDLTTWPGHLAISGDCGTYVFARLHDMFEFFRPDRYAGSDLKYAVNPYYWGEKLQAPRGRDSVKSFDDEQFREAVEEWFESTAEDMDDAERQALRTALDDEVLSDWSWPHTRDDAVVLMGQFSHNGHRISEPWDYDMREFDHMYLWCCWAIVQGIAQYDWAKGWR